MILHRYMSSHLEDVLINRRLRVAKASTFNDPFEFCYRHEGTYDKATAERVLIRRIQSGELIPKVQAIPEFSDWSEEKIIQHMMKNSSMVLPHMVEFTPKTHQGQINAVHHHGDSTMRVVCFSDIPTKQEDEILLWSHYAKSHEGIRIWLNSDYFEYPLNRLYQVHYEPSPPAIQNEALDSEKHYSRIIRKALVTKSSCWDYEKEFRAFIPNDYFDTVTIQGEDHDFVTISEESIVRIDFGIKHPAEERIRLISEFKSNGYGHVEWNQAQMSDDNYLIDYIRLE